MRTSSGWSRLTSSMARWYITEGVTTSSPPHCGRLSPITTNRQGSAAQAIPAASTISSDAHTIDLRTIGATSSR